MRKMSKEKIVISQYRNELMRMRNEMRSQGYLLWEDYLKQLKKDEKKYKKDNL